MLRIFFFLKVLAKSFRKKEDFEKKKFVSVLLNFFEKFILKSLCVVQIFLYIRGIHLYLRMTLILWKQPGWH